MMEAVTATVPSSKGLLLPFPDADFPLELEVNWVTHYRRRRRALTVEHDRPHGSEPFATSWITEAIDSEGRASLQMMH